MDDRMDPARHGIVLVLLDDGVRRLPVTRQRQPNGVGQPPLRGWVALHGVPGSVVRHRGTRDAPRNAARMRPALTPRVVPRRTCVFYTQVSRPRASVAIRRAPFRYPSAWSFDAMLHRLQALRLGNFFDSRFVGRV
jgi:hypothetical protein